MGMYPGMGMGPCGQTIMLQGMGMGMGPGQYQFIIGVTEYGKIEDSSYEEMVSILTNFEGNDYLNSLVG